MKTTMRTAPLLPLALFAATSLGCLAEKIEHVDPRLTPAERSFPQDLASAYCEALFACDGLDDCEAISEYTDTLACIEGESAKLGQAQSEAVDEGLAFDADCAQETIAKYETYGCAAIVQLGLRLEDQDKWLCPPYHGSFEEGRPCETVWPTAFSECGADMICFDDCTAIGEAACVCDEGFACTINSGGECLPIVADGELCFTDAAIGACGEGSYCALPDPLPPEGEPVEWRCQPRVALGEPCGSHDACQSGACEGDVCVPGMPALCEPALAPGKWL